MSSRILFFPVLMILGLLTACDGQSSIRQGGEAIKQEDWVQAEQLFRTATEENPENKTAWNGLGIAQYNQGKGNEAIASFEKAYPIQENPGEEYGSQGVSAYYLGLLNYGWTGDYDKATGFFQESAALGHEVSSCYTHLGIMKGNTDPVGALEEFNKAVEADPDDSFARSNRAFMNAALGIYRDALADYDILIQNEPENYDHWGNRGYSYVGQENWPKALSDFEESVRLNPEFADGWMYVALCNYQMGNLPIALESIDKAVALSPQNGRIHYYKGVILAEMDQTDAACSELLEAEKFGNVDGINLRIELCK